MLHNHQLFATLSADRQARLQSAAARHRLVRRNKVPPVDQRVDQTSATVISVVWRDDADPFVNQQRAHCVA